METSQVGGINSYSSSSTAPNNNSLISTVDFLQLLTMELQYQDPLSPMDNKDFLAQLAQIQTLQVLDTIKTALEKESRMAEFSAAAGLLGCEVKTPQGSGVVEKVQKENGEILLIVDGNPWKLEDISEIVTKTEAEND